MAISDRVLNEVSALPSMSKYLSHYYCDFIELLALISEDSISISSVLERFYDGGGENEELIGTELSANEEDDRFVRIAGWFSMLGMRRVRFMDFYPFDIDDEGWLSLKKDLTPKNKEYLFYLLASTMSYSTVKSELTSFFEQASAQALSCYLPQEGKCFIFGKTMNANGRYKGSLKDKIDKLAEDISRATVYREKMFGPNNSGDGGLDVVAWVPFHLDSCLDNTQLYLCQSAAGKNWLEKQDSVSRIANYVDLPKSSQNIIFIPYDARDEEGRFTEQGSITADIVFDRSRLMRFTPVSMFDDPAFKDAVSIVDFAVAYTESIV